MTPAQTHSADPDMVMAECMDLWTRIDLLRASHVTSSHKEQLCADFFDNVLHMYVHVLALLKDCNDPATIIWLHEAVAHIERQFHDVFKQANGPEWNANKITLARLRARLEAALNVKIIIPAANQ